MNAIAAENEKIRALIEIHEEERAEIGRRLNNEIGTMLSAIKMRLTMSRNVEHEVLSNLDSTIESLRNISTEMWPVILKKYGLAEAVKELVSKSTQVRIFIRNWEEFSLSDKYNLLIFRIIQEFVAGIKQYGCGWTELSATVTDSSYMIILQTESAPFASTAIDLSKSKFFLNMESKAQAMRGTVEFSRNADDRCMMRLAIPRE